MDWMRCDQCEALMINGVFCHETGCPNMHSRYDPAEDRWIKTYECRECGFRQDVGVECCNDLCGDGYCGLCPACADEEDAYLDDCCPDCGRVLDVNGACPVCDIGIGEHNLI